MDRKRIEEILARFKSKRIAVAGDFFLDRIFYINREWDEPSVETGLTAYQVASRKLLPGAAGVVTNNLSAFGVEEIYSVALTGEDGEGFDLARSLRETGVKTDYMVSSGEVVTPTYTKTMFDYECGPEETHRIDIQNRKPTPKEVEKRLTSFFYELAEKTDAIICLEQLKNGKYGVFTEAVLSALSDIAKRKPELIILADSRYHILDFKHMVLKCNDIEAVRAAYPGEIVTDSSEIDDELLCRSMKKIAACTDRHVFVSCGSRGIKVLESGAEAEIVTVPAYRVEGPIDICGAGDAASCVIACALGSGATPQEAALIGNLVASITIQQLGVTGTASVPQILARYDEYSI